MVDGSVNKNEHRRPNPPVDAQKSITYNMLKSPNLDENHMGCPSQRQVNFFDHQHHITKPQSLQIQPPSRLAVKTKRKI